MCSHRCTARTRRCQGRLLAPEGRVLTSAAGGRSHWSTVEASYLQKYTIMRVCIEAMWIEAVGIEVV